MLRGYRGVVEEKLCKSQSTVGHRSVMLATWEAVVGRFQVLGQPGQFKEIMSENKK